MTRVSLIALFLVAFAILVAGCSSSSGPSYATPVATQYQTAPVTTIASSSVASSIAEVIVSASSDTWDADIENDGVAVSIWFQDEKEKTVYWDGPPLTVDIEIWTVTGLPGEKVALVYKGQGTIEESFDKIRISFEDMNVPSGETLGATFAKVTLPNGKTYEGVGWLTSLVP